MERCEKKMGKIKGQNIKLRQGINKTKSIQWDREFLLY